LHALTPVVFRLEETDFTDYFDWIVKSMVTRSEADPDQSDEVNLLGNVRMDQDMSSMRGL